MECCRAAAQAAAASSSASPGNGTPVLSMRMPIPASGLANASITADHVIAVHILDDPMAEYGEHESTDDPLQVLRHSTAHLLAAAVTELYPDAKYAIGPPVQDGFYYDFAFAQPVSESELGAIESRMRRIVNEDRPFV